MSGTEQCVIYGCDRKATEATRHGPMFEMDASDLPTLETATEQ